MTFLATSSSGRRPLSPSIQVSSINLPTVHPVLKTSATAHRRTALQVMTALNAVQGVPSHLPVSASGA